MINKYFHCWHSHNEIKILIFCLILKIVYIMFIFFHRKIIELYFLNLKIEIVCDKFPYLRHLYFYYLFRFDSAKSTWKKTHFIFNSHILINHYVWRYLCTFIWKVWRYLFVFKIWCIWNPLQYRIVAVECLPIVVSLIYHAV